MNAKLFVLLFAMLALLSGCNPVRYAAAPVFPDSTPMPLPDPKPDADPEVVLQRAAGQPVAPFAGAGWRELFDGKSFAGWRVTEFDQGGSVTVTNGMLVLQRGNPFVGVNGTNEIPKVNYEIAFDALRVAGNDFFCGLTFPVNDAWCSLIIGGWGGGIVGLSNVDGGDASENETTKYISFETGRWYRLRLRVTEQRIEAWIEQKKVVDLVTTGRKLEVRFGEIMLSRPFGLAAWDTSAAYRAIKIRPVNEPADPPRY
jgi:hypothetical protein